MSCSRGHRTDKSPFLLPLNQCGRKPVKTLIKTIAGCSTTCLNVPLTIRWAKSVQTKFVSHLGSAHSVRKILLVGENEKDSIAQFILVQHSVHLITGSINTIRIVRVNNKDQSLSVLIVMAPQRTDLILTTDIPNCERDVLVLDSFDVESDSRNGGDDCKQGPWDTRFGFPCSARQETERTFPAMPRVVADLHQWCATNSTMTRTHLHQASICREW